ncbi:MAG TPA: mycofactocin precursor MftA [Streptosporangiaceae bacterium]|nr:mycofactocin precursor MftA [Streptosporangiaceae bacterium]
MSEQTASTATPAGHAAAPTTAEPAGPAADESLVAEELLVEEVSIDGMCGVY